MIDLKFLNYAVKVTNGNEFRVLYIIANNEKLQKEGRAKIYRDQLADIIGLSTKQITRLTDSLVEKGLLKKDLVSNGDKSVCFYSLNLDKFVQQSDGNVDKNVQISAMNLDKNVPLKKTKKDIKKLKNTIEKEIEEKREFKTVCTERLPDEMDLADYLRAVGRM